MIRSIVAREDSVYGSKSFRRDLTIPGWTGRYHEVGLEASEDQYRKVPNKGVQDA